MLIGLFPDNSTTLVALFRIHDINTYRKNVWEDTWKCVSCNLVSWSLPAPAFCVTLNMLPCYLICMFLSCRKQKQHRWRPLVPNPHFPRRDTVAPLLDERVPHPLAGVPPPAEVAIHRQHWLLLHGPVVWSGACLQGCTETASGFVLAEEEVVTTTGSEQVLRFGSDRPQLWLWLMPWEF